MLGLAALAILLRFRLGTLRYEVDVRRAISAISITRGRSSNSYDSSKVLACLSYYQNPMSPTLEGKIAIVTGASRSRGIGSQVAYELAKRGAKVSGEHSDKGHPTTSSVFIMLFS